MTRSEESPARAREVLRTIGTLFSSEHVTAAIDEPIERAAVSFQLPEATPQDQEQILALVAAFLRHVYREAFPQGKQLTAEQARDEALAALEYVQGGSGRVGYYELLLGLASSSAEDLPLVLWRVAEWIKAQKHYEYRRWVIIRHITWAPWPLKLALARELIQLINECQPSAELNLPAEFWVESLEDLVDMALSLDLLSELEDAARAPSETGSGLEPPMQ